MKGMFAEVRCTYFDDGLREWFIDGWKTDNDNEEGVIVATINEDTFEVNYRKAEYKKDPIVLEVVKDKLREIVCS